MKPSMSFDFEIVSMERSGVEQYQALLYDIIEELHSKNKWLPHLKQPYTLEKLVGMLADPSACCLAAIDKFSDVVGIFAGRHDGGLGLVHWLGVNRSYRYQGIGSALLVEAERVFIESGCHAVELRTLLDSDHLETYYQRRGYETAALLPNYRFGVNAIHMLKQLDSLSISLSEKLAANI